jgi:deazaflavin-dependent oxidoreductase (nitroreductase family)
MVGKINRKPNALQKILHRFFMLRPVTAFFAPRVHRIDKAILKLTKGKYTGSQILGWNIIQLTTIGAKSEQLRTLPLVALFDEERIALIATNFGRKHNPAWYYNLKAHPECRVEWKERTGTYFARETNGGEYEDYWRLARSYFEGYEKYRERASPRHIPVMLLEPKR